MKLVNLIFKRLAVTTLEIENQELFSAVVSAEKQTFSHGIYKNGPTLLETQLSSFGQPGKHEFKVYIPVSSKVDSNTYFKYMEELKLNGHARERLAFDEHLAEKIGTFKADLSISGLKIKEDKLYIVIYPVYGEYWGDFIIPVGED